jgi:hypothetical protein
MAVGGEYTPASYRPTGQSQDLCSRHLFLFDEQNPARKLPKKQPLRRNPRKGCRAVPVGSVCSGVYDPENVLEQTLDGDPVPLAGVVGHLHIPLMAAWMDGRAEAMIRKSRSLAALGRFDAEDVARRSDGVTRKIRDGLEVGFGS